MVWGGFVLPLVGILGMFIFSVSLFFNISVIMVWLYLELASLCLIPLFFSGTGLVSFSGLFYYIVFSGISSGLLLSGLLIPECVFLLTVGLLMKFGVFPLWGWVYHVCRFSNWLVVWGLSTVLKVSFVFFSVFLVLSDDFSIIPLLFCGVGCLVLSLLFWVYTFDWKVCWCHIMLCSSSVLVGLSLSGCGLFDLFLLFFVYFFWASFVIFYLSLGGSSVFDSMFSMCVFCFLLLSIPVSFSIFYKVVVCSCIFSSGVFLLFCWVLYSFSEQFYLFFTLTGLWGVVGGSLFSRGF